MGKKRVFRFAGTDELVGVSDADEVIEHLPAVFPYWPIQELEDTGSATVLDIAREKGKYRFSVFGQNIGKAQRDALNAACILVAELAWARLRHEPDLLCFHGAAVEIGDGLVLFPNRRRAGKSTLTACLARRGAHVFTDDYLPRTLGEDGRFYGIANGVAPRLRLPIPEGFSAELASWIENNPGPLNKQYKYLSLGADDLARHGARLPVTSVVLLDRQDDPVQPGLTDVGSATVLRRLIVQNFSRSMNPARILALVGRLVDTSNCLSLTYSSADEAADHLLGNARHFKKRPLAEGDTLALPPEKYDFFQDSGVFVAGQRYIRNPETHEQLREGGAFVASPNGPGLHFLEGVALGIWNLYREPVLIGEVVDILAGAFPDQDRDQIAIEAELAVRFLAEQGLIVPQEEA